MTSIDDIPTEVFDHILSFLTSLADKLRVLRVCARWRVAGAAAALWCAPGLDAILDARLAASLAGINPSVRVQVRVKEDTWKTLDAAAWGRLLQATAGVHLSGQLPRSPELLQLVGAPNLRVLCGDLHNVLNDSASSVFNAVFNWSVLAPTIEELNWETPRRPFGDEPVILVSEMAGLCDALPRLRSLRVELPMMESHLIRNVHFDFGARRYPAMRELYVTAHMNATGQCVGELASRCPELRVLEVLEITVDEALLFPAATPPPPNLSCLSGITIPTRPIPEAHVYAQLIYLDVLALFTPASRALNLVTRAPVLKRLSLHLSLSELSILHQLPASIRHVTVDITHNSLREIGRTDQARKDAAAETLEAALRVGLTGAPTTTATTAPPLLMFTWKPLFWPTGAFEGDAEVNHDPWRGQVHIDMPPMPPERFDDPQLIDATITLQRVD